MLLIFRFTDVDHFYANIIKQSILLYQVGSLFSIV